MLAPIKNEKRNEKTWFYEIPCKSNMCTLHGVRVIQDFKLALQEVFIIKLP